MCRWNIWCKHGTAVLLHHHTHCVCIFIISVAVFGRILYNVNQECPQCVLMFFIPHPAAGRRHTGWSSSWSVYSKHVFTISTTSKILRNTALGQQQAAAALTVHQNKHQHLIQDTKQLLACIRHFVEGPISFGWRSVLHWVTYSFHNSAVESWDLLIKHQPR